MSQDRSRTYTWEDQSIGPAAARNRSGLDYLRAIAAGELPPPAIVATMNMNIGEVDEGRVVFTAVPQEYHYNPMGVVHGGLAATLLDSALGCAVLSTLAQGFAFTTLELHINYTRTITTQTGELRCEARVIHGGRQIATAEARLTDANGKLYAHGTTTCMIFPLDRPQG